MIDHSDAVTKLEKLVGEMTPGPWSTDGTEGIDQDSEPWGKVVGTEVVGRPYMTWERLVLKQVDARGIVALRNLAPALLDVVRDMHKIQHVYGDPWAEDYVTETAREALSRLDAAIMEHCK